MLVWVVLLALFGLSLWIASPTWLTNLPAAIERLPKLPREMMGSAEKDPFLSTILAIVTHPLSAVAAWLYVAYLWIKDELAAVARAREEEKRLPPLSAADRVRLFAHRLGLVVTFLLLIFPGIPIFLAEPGAAVVWAIVPPIAYFAMRLVGWVVAALFQ